MYSEGGTWYVKSGLTEAIDNSSATATTMIQWALDNLTAARTQKEIVKIIGSPTVTQVTIPSYSAIDLIASKPIQGASANTNMFINNDTTGGNTQIEIFGGIIDGNKAGQSLDAANYNTRNTIMLQKVTDSSIHDTYILNSNSSGVYLRDCTNTKVFNNSIVTPRKLGLYHFATSAGAGKWTWFNHNYISNTGENFLAAQGVSDVWMDGNSCDTSGTTGININGSRIHILNNYLKDATTVGIVVSTEGDYTSDYSEVINNTVWEAKTGGISVNTAFISDYLTIKDNKCKGATSGQATSAQGLRLFGGLAPTLDNNKCWAWQRSGISFEGSSVSVGGRALSTNKGSITNNKCWDNGINTGVATPEYRSGINLSGTAGTILGTIVSGNHCWDTLGASGTQLYGISYKNTTDVYIHHNDVRGNRTAGILDNTGNTTPKVNRNLGYVTENSGTATVASGATTSVVTHGLAITPSLNDIKITPTNSMGNSTKYFISTPTSTQFTITVNTDPGATTATFVWEYRTL